MKKLSKNIITVLVTGLWVNGSEFFRNEVLLKPYWTEHYRKLGLIFPSDPVNGIVWMIWGFLFAFIMFLLSQKYSLLSTILISWLVGFVLMWHVLWNLLVLPDGLLLYAIPLSFLEVFISAILCKKIPVL